MKKIVAVTVLLFLITGFLKAQTTWIDYRYITAGMKDDLSKGKDIKQGYFLETIGTESGVTQQGIERKAQLYYFKRGNVNYGYVVRCSDSKYNLSYYCIPTADASSDIWNMALNAMSTAGQEWQLVFAWALAKVVSQKL